MPPRRKKIEQTESVDTPFPAVSEDVVLQKKAFETQARIERLERLFDNLLREVKPYESRDGERREIALRNENERLRSRIVRLENEIVSLDAKVFSTRNTISFQLGAAILATKTLAGLMALPRRLLALRRETKRRKIKWGGHATLIANQAEDRSRLDRLGVRAACEGVISDGGGELVVMRRLLSLLALEVEREGSQAHLVYEFVKDQEPSAFDHARCAFWLAKAGYIDATLEALRLASADPLVLTEGERSLMRRLEGMKAIKAQLPSMLEARNPSPGPSSKRVVYCTNAAPPYSISGYSIRTHEMMREGTASFEVVPALRAGYQRDYAIPDETFTFEGVTYSLIGGPSRRKAAMHDWVEAGARRIAELAGRESACLIHAASNYLNALPALVAARRCGLPFVYEVRGLWELSASALSPGWMKSEEFSFAREMEIFVAQKADRVITISQALAKELTDRGVDAGKITVAHNGVDTDRFRPGEKDQALSRRYGLDDCFVIGFFGSCMNYEGLLLLADVMSQMISSGHNVKLLVCGSGSGLEALKKRLEARRQAECLVSIPHVPFQDISKFLHLADVVAIPRLDVPVCRIVPAMKTLEAMASGRPVLASNLPVLREYVTSNKDGFLLPPGNATAWTIAIEKLKRNPSLREEMGRRAVTTARDRFSWSSTMRTIEAVWDEVSREIK